MIITRSEERDPVRNIRVIMPGHEQTYQQQPFNPRWLERVRPFQAVRFMDWGATNNWGQPDPWTWDDTRLFTWAERATPDHYTWATEKGIPYEMMIHLMNDYDLDGWVTIPHRASPEYIRSMAELFNRTLEPGRVLTVEYSNELWNWMFGQAQWLNTFTDQSNPWPERIVPSIQRALDIFTDVFGNNSPRLRRVVGVQTAWLDVSQRVVFSMRPGSFDAVAPSWYFGLSEEADAELDRLGNRATPRDIDRLVRQSWDSNEKQWIQDIYYEVAQPLGLPLAFYEGGQHLTPTPFGEEPTYARALVDIQRDPLMLGLYRDWFAFLKSLVPRGQENEFSFMHFSLVGARSAQYGSWGLLETLDQDLNRVPAPKWQAILEQLGSR
jgi:hypothetical protein